MNLNDILAQQQASLNAAFQTSQRFVIGIALVELALSVLFCWVVYMFYARIRDIAGEMRRFRIAYEVSHHPTPPERSLTSGLLAFQALLPKETLIPNTCRSDDQARTHTDGTGVPT